MAFIDLTKKGDLTIQSDPDCFIRIIRFARRDTREYEDGPGGTRRPVWKYGNDIRGLRHSIPETSVILSETIDIADDILGCSISHSKKNTSSRLQVELSPGKTNYHALLHPGDHIFVWMKREKTYDDSGRPIRNYSNATDSGLKFWGFITEVSRAISTSPDSARKHVTYSIGANSWSSFLERDIYYNGVIASEIVGNPKIFEMTVLTRSGSSSSIEPVAATLNRYRPDDMVRTLLQTYIGSSDSIGVKTKILSEEFPIPVSENKVFYLPSGVGNIFSKTPGLRAQSQTIIGGAIRLCDITSLHMGILNYQPNSPEPIFSYPMEGLKFFSSDMGNKQTLWSLMQGYSNGIVNEMFADLRPNREGFIFPTFVFRQIPFTSDNSHQKFEQKEIRTTRFLDLPRVKIDERWITGEHLGRSDQEMINYIQLFGPNTSDSTEGIGVAGQTIRGNYAVDEGSIFRVGLRTMITRTDFISAVDRFSSPLDQDRHATNFVLSLVEHWINLLADWWLGSHVYESGTFELVGIEEPITIGDNIQVTRAPWGKPDLAEDNDEIYHIEGYNHSYVNDSGSGVKTFHTSVTVSRGQLVITDVAIDSSTARPGNNQPIYAKEFFGKTNSSNQDGQFSSGSVPGIGFSSDSFEPINPKGNDSNPGDPPGRFDPDELKTGKE